MPAMAACPCQAQLSTCSEVASPGTLVFIGKVESINPKFLSSWSISRRPDLNQLNQAYEHYLGQPSPQTLAALKSVLKKLFPDISENLERRLTAARSHSTLSKLFDEILNTGTLVRFRVEEVYRAHGDDDDDDDVQSLSPKKDFSVWTPFGDCGVAFQAGERYLVYAVADEGTDHVETNVCTRTRRLSDAGSELAYLYYYKNHAKTAGRIEGFVTYDPRLHLEFGMSLDSVKITAPAPNTVVRLESGSEARYARAAADGRFVFDGLAPGDYELSAYAPGFPDALRRLSAPQMLHMKERGCATRTLLIPSGSP